ncbi:SIR2 family protein [Marinifilum fragile]|uniref:SIR2 family protein n=1 Tax=Marinifilum fragile TaxID=570161 RepID=UPI0006D1256F|nr:SIR2 family protein [Marinifilum fragile]
MAKELIYLTGNKKIAVEKNDNEIINVFVNDSKYKKDDLETRSLDQIASDLKRKAYNDFLSKRFENVIILTGAGSSFECGGPLMSTLWDETEKKINNKASNGQKPKFDQLLEKLKFKSKSKNLETLLSKAKIAKDYIENNEDINGFISETEEIIKKRCDLKLKETVTHTTFLKKLVKRKSTDPRVKVFTLNYDTLFEQAAQKLGITVIDGFSFATPRLFNGNNFDYDIVHREKSRLKDEDNFIQNVIHLYKPHGSLNWESKEGQVYQVENPDEPLMIYPHSGKYESSYEQPFFEMMSRFQQAIRTPNTLLISIGFSFGDKHIVTAIQEALNHNTGFQLMVVNKGVEGNDKLLIEAANIYEDIVLVDELFEDFAIHYPELKSYNSNEARKIEIFIPNEK